MKALRWEPDGFKGQQGGLCDQSGKAQEFMWAMRGGQVATQDTTIRCKDRSSLPLASSDSFYTIPREADFFRCPSDS